MGRKQRPFARALASILGREARGPMWLLQSWASPSAPETPHGDENGLSLVRAMAPRRPKPSNGNGDGPWGRGPHCHFKTVLDADGWHQTPRTPLNEETALPCKAGPFVLDALDLYSEGLGGSFEKRIAQLIYAEALGGVLLDMQAGQVGDDAGYEVDSPSEEPASMQLSLNKRIWDSHQGLDYSRFFGLGANSDCDYCSLDYWVNAETSHLTVVDYEADVYGARQNVRYSWDAQRGELEAVCQAIEKGEQAPLTDPTIAQFAAAGPERASRVLRMRGKCDRECDFFVPCALSARFVERYHEARRKRSLVPNRADDELWIAVHLRWGDLGDRTEDPRTATDNSGTFMNKVMNLDSLITQTLRIQKLLAQRTKRTLVVHLFSEISADLVKDFTGAVNGTRLHVDTAPPQTLDLWSQCEVSLGRSSSQFFAVAAHLATKSIIFDAGGRPFWKNVRHPIVPIVDESFLAADWEEAANHVLEPCTDCLGSSTDAPTPRRPPFSEQSEGQSWTLLHPPTAVGASHVCPDGQRNAAESECLDAVHEVAQTLELPFRGLRVVDEGADGVVPGGCSYSFASKRGVFNRNSAGRSSPLYQLVCERE